MDMTGEQRIAAPRDIVWKALNDAAVLKQCIPGCESIEKVSDTEMTAKVVLKIGPVKASFGGKVTLSELDPPNGYRITGEGSGGVAGFAKGGALVKLEADGGATILRYEVKGEIGGKIAQLGSRLIDSTARKLAGDFFTALDAVVAPPATAEKNPETPLPNTPLPNTPLPNTPVSNPPGTPVGAPTQAAETEKVSWYSKLFKKQPASGE